MPCTVSRTISCPSFAGSQTTEVCVMTNARSREVTAQPEMNTRSPLRRRGSLVSNPSSVGLRPTEDYRHDKKMVMDAIRRLANQWDLKHAKLAEERTIAKRNKVVEELSRAKCSVECDDNEVSTATGSASSLTGVEMEPIHESEGKGACAAKVQRSISVTCAPSQNLMVCFLDIATLPSSPAHIAAASGSMRLMCMCGYEMYDICVVLAFASAYFACITQPALVKGDMALEERENLLTVCIFVAHSFVLDTNCPLHVWREMVLKGRCSMAALNKATVHVLRLRSFRLRISDENFDRRLRRLLRHTNLEKD